MGLVDQHHGTIFLADTDHVLERCDIAEHRIDAFEDDQFASFGGQSFQPFFERFDVIVAEGDNLGIAHCAAVVDRGMAVGVENDIVALAGECRDDAQIRLITGGKDHCMVHRVKFLERILAVAMQAVGAVEHSAAGRAGAKFFQRFQAGLAHIIVKGHAHVVIRAEENGFLAITNRNSW